MYYTLKPDFGDQFLDITCNDKTSVLGIYWLFVKDALFNPASKTSWLDVMKGTAAWSDSMAKIITGVFDPKVTRTRPMKKLLEPQSLQDAYGCSKPMSLLASYFLGSLGIGGFDLAYKVKDPYVEGRPDPDLTDREVIDAALALKFHDEVFRPQFLQLLEDCKAQVAQGSTRADGKVWYFDMPTVGNILTHFRTFAQQIREIAASSGGVRFNFEADHYMPTVRAAIGARLFKLIKNDANENVVDEYKEQVDTLIECRNLVNGVVKMIDESKQSSLVSQKAQSGTLKQIAALMKTLLAAKPAEMPFTNGASTIALHCPLKTTHAGGRKSLIYDLAPQARPFAHSVEKLAGDNGWQITGKSFLTDAFGASTESAYVTALTAVNDVVTDLESSAVSNLTYAKTLMSAIATRIGALGSTCLLDYLFGLTSAQWPVSLREDGSLVYRVKGAWGSIAWLISSNTVGLDGAVMPTRNLVHAVIASLLDTPLGARASTAATVLGPHAFDSAVAPGPSAPTVRDADDSGKKRSWEYSWSYIDSLLERASKKEMSGLALVDIGGLKSKLVKPTAFSADGKLKYAATALKYEDGPIFSIDVSDVWEFMGVYSLRFIRLDDLQMTLNGRLLNEMLEAATSASATAVKGSSAPLGTISADGDLIFHAQQYILSARDKFDDFVCSKLIDEGVSFEPSRLNTNYTKQLISACAASAAYVSCSVASAVAPAVGAALRHLLASAEQAAQRSKIPLFRVGQLPKMARVAHSAQTRRM